MARAQFVELELHGSADEALGFIEGFRTAAGREVGPVWYSHREPVDLGSVVEAIRERMHVETHVILPADLAARVTEAIGVNDLVKLEVASVREIDYAELGFDFRCFTAEDASAIRRVIEEDLPDGLRLEDYAVTEDAAEDARGVELYSPVHHFVCAGRGRYVGPADAIFGMAYRLRDQDFIHPGKIKLHHAS